MIMYTKPPEDSFEELKRLYKVCFDEMDSAVDTLFGEYALADFCYAAVSGGHIISALYLLPAYIAQDGTQQQAHYLFAAGTLPEYRGKGIMNGLISYALKEAAARGDRYSVLLPANAGLYGYYARFGYLALFRVKNVYLTQSQALQIPPGDCKVTNCSFDKLANLRFNILLGHNGSLLWDKRHIMLAHEIGKEYGGGLFYTGNGAVFYAREKESVFAYEIICENRMLGALLSAFVHHVPASGYRLRLPAFYTFAGETVRYGMIKPLTGAGLPDHSECPYLGLALD